jgi:DNA-binding MarR family transcriptional regulator
MMSTTSHSTSSFNPAVLGQAEKALNAILVRHLAGTGLTEPQWVALTLTVTGGGTIAHHEIADRVAGALKVDRSDARARIAELGEAGLVTVPEDDATPVAVTDAGAELYGRIRGVVTEVTQRLWGDLTAAELDTAGRVLSIVLARANAELADL